jgi:hypothetical protein
MPYDGEVGAVGKWIDVTALEGSYGHGCPCSCSVPEGKRQDAIQLGAFFWVRVDRAPMAPERSLCVCVDTCVYVYMCIGVPVCMCVCICRSVWPRRTGLPAAAALVGAQFTVGIWWCCCWGPAVTLMCVEACHVAA